MNTTHTGFWSSGFSIFSDELTKEEKARLDPLTTELKNTTAPTRREELKLKIAAIKAEFRTRRRNARSSLFVRA